MRKRGALVNTNQAGRVKKSSETTGAGYFVLQSEGCLLVQVIVRRPGDVAVLP